MRLLPFLWGNCGDSDRHAVSRASAAVLISVLTGPRNHQLIESIGGIFIFNSSSVNCRCMCIYSIIGALGFALRRVLSTSPSAAAFNLDMGLIRQGSGATAARLNWPVAPCSQSSSFSFARIHWARGLWPKDNESENAPHVTDSTRVLLANELRLKFGAPTSEKASAFVFTFTSWLAKTNSSPMSFPPLFTAFHRFSANQLRVGRTPAPIDSVCVADAVFSIRKKNYSPIFISRAGRDLHLFSLNLCIF